MALYRETAEKLVETYDFDWKDNLRMKEVCICSVESLIANTVNIVLLVFCAMITGLWREIATYFLTFASIRGYAGGTHAKDYMRCITSYVTIMLACIGCVKYCIPSAGFYVCTILLVSIFFSGWINWKYAAKQKNYGTKRAAYRKRALMMHRIITVFMIGMFMIYMKTHISFLREMIMIQSFALIIQSIALWMERKECVNEAQGGMLY